MNCSVRFLLPRETVLAHGDCAVYPLMLLSINTKLLPALVWALAPLSISCVLECSTAENWRCFCCPHRHSPARCFWVPWVGQGFCQTISPSPSSGGGFPSSLCTVKHNCTLQGRVAGKWGEKHLIHTKCMVGIQVLKDRSGFFQSELKEAIYVPCNFHFEVPQI